MSKIHKISISFICLMLVISVACGFVTRAGFKRPDYFSNDISYSPEYIHETIQNLSSGGVIRAAETRNGAFIVTIKNSEVVYGYTRAIAEVDEVVKGDSELKGKEIVIYQHISNIYKDETMTEGHLSTFVCNNLMREGKQYLVFADKVPYGIEYENTLDRAEYMINYDIGDPEFLENFVPLTLYSFPLEYEEKYIKPDTEINSYYDIMDYDYLCFSEEDAEKITEIRNAVLEHFLNQ